MKQSKLIIYVTPAGLRQRMLVQENASVSGIRLLQKISDNVKELIPVVSQAPEGTYGRVTFVAGRQHGRRQTSGDYEVSKSASAAQARDVKKLFDNIVQACRQQEECLSCEIIPEIQPPTDIEMQALSSQFEAQQLQQSPDDARFILDTSHTS